LPKCLICEARNSGNFLLFHEAPSGFHFWACAARSASSRRAPRNMPPSA
jgi:hypothetical protein